MARQMHVSVFLLLLLLLFAQLYGTRGILAEQSTGVVRELPRKGQGASQAYTVSTTDRKFIRIHASTEDLTKGKYCSEKEEVIKDFSGKDVNCDGFIFQIYTEEMISTFIKTSIPAAIKLHADRLLVDPVSEPLVVPKFDENNACKNFTVPPEHHSKGVNDADMVLYVAARPVTLFHAVCARNKDGRPIAAGFNIFLSERKSLREEVRLMAHDIAHVLGFDYNVFLEKNMVIESNFEDGKKKRVLVNSTKTKEMVQKHYGCSAADGMELEYERWKTQASSHWNYRVAKDDLMSSRYKHGGAMYYTALTMSVFDDLEYYSANWGMEEPMTWGNKSDCYLLDNNYNDEFVKKYPGMFCVPGAPFSCTSDRTGVGYCDPNAFYTDHDREESRALYIRYEKGTLSHSATRMCNENRSLTLSGSVFADDSLCLDTDVYKTNGKENISYTGVCARVSCDKGKVKVMYAGISEWKECPENKSLEVDRGDSDTPITLKCPKYSEVCTIAPDGSSRLPLVIPPGEKPETIPSLPQAAPTPPAPTAHPPKPDPVQGKGSTQPTTRTTGTDRRNTDIHSGTVPSQSVEKSASTESGNKGRQKRDNTNAAGSANENTDASSSSSSSSSSLPSGSHPIGGTNTADSATTAISLSKEGPPSPQAPGEINLRLGTDGTPAAAYVLHVVFLIMAVALAVPL